MTEKKSAGRPKKELTDEEIAQIEHLAKGMTVQQIADYFGMGETTFHKVKKRDKAIYEAYKRYRAKTHNSVVNRLFDIIEGNSSHTFPAIAFYLKTQSGWKENKDADITIDTANNDKLIVHFNNVAKTVEN